MYCNVFEWQPFGVLVPNKFQLSKKVLQILFKHTLQPIGKFASYKKVKENPVQAQVWKYLSKLWYSESKKQDLPIRSEKNFCLGTVIEWHIKRPFLHQISSWSSSLSSRRLLNCGKVHFYSKNFLGQAHVWSWLMQSGLCLKEPIRLSVKVVPKIYTYKNDLVQPVQLRGTRFF